MSEPCSFRAEMWMYETTAAPWHLITLPKAAGAQVKFLAADIKQGWGSVPVKVTIGATTWKTSVFPDKKSGSYVLPIKAEVRRKEALVCGKKISVTLEVM